MIQIEDLEKRITALEQRLTPAETHTEPRPLLADAKVGDLCKTDLDEWIQIDDTSEPPSPILYHFDRPFKGNIIHTEPLAQEETKEWAVQIMKLGYKVTKGHISHIYWQYDASPHLKCISEYNCGTLQIMVVPEIWLTTADPTGWQIYEAEPALQANGFGDYEPSPHPNLPAPGEGQTDIIHKIQNCDPLSLSLTNVSEIVGRCLFNLAGKGEPSSYFLEQVESRLEDMLSKIAEHPSPQPKVNVGDWVEYMGYQRLITAVPVGQPLPDNKTWYAKDIFGNECMIYTDNITRKLDPSEVKVSITLEGTVCSVRYECDGSDRRFYLVLPNGAEVDLDLDWLFPADAALVRELTETKGVLK